MKLQNLEKKLKKNKVKLKKFLKKFDTKFIPELQEQVEKLDAKVWSKTDCLKCGNCCSKMTPTFTSEDLKRISSHLNMTISDFKKKYLYKDATGDWMNINTPCQFLGKDLKCSIYDIRPFDCSAFPHHHNKPFDDYNHVYEANMAYCPATYSLVSKLEKYISKNYEW